MLNYPVAPEVVEPFVPRGTELDFWQGRTYVSVVGFLFLDTRVWGVGIPYHRDFEEVNLRFYVRRQGPEGWRRGVCFVKEIVPRAAIATVARVVYNEPYVALPMRHRVDVAAGVAEYGWRHGGRWSSIRASFSGAPRPLTAGSEAEFITAFQDVVDESTVFAPTDRLKPVGAECAFSLELADVHAVAKVGAAAVGALAEKPELFGRLLIFIGLAEGIAIYGLIVSILILNRMT